MEIKYIDGGVTAPKGFLASGIYCGIKQGSVKKDLALIYSEVPAKASGMFTKNKVSCRNSTILELNLARCLLIIKVNKPKGENHNERGI